MTAIAEGSPSRLQADPLAGTPYRVLRRLGAGAMGQVFEAEHTALRRRAAVKVLKPALVSDPAFVDRMRLEAQALASVRHPNVVLVFDCGVTSAGVPYLATELLEGRTLQSLLRERGALPLVEALGILEEVFAGLTAIHRAGLTHRDLKPGNVFVCEEEGRRLVKLLDFGLVKVSGHGAASALAPLRFPTQEQHVIGTPACMAPEQIVGSGCDARTDVYAAGVLVFFLVAGRHPFHAYGSDLEILTAHATEPAPLLSATATQRIPTALDAAVARALAKDPAERYASIADFGAALRASLASPPAWKRDVTEKIRASTFRGGGSGTAPIDPAAFRAPGKVLPFAPVHDPSPRPSRELPVREPLCPAPPPPSAAPPRAWLPELASEDRLLHATIALLFGVLLFVAWRML